MHSQSTKDGRWTWTGSPVLNHTSCVKEFGFFPGNNGKPWRVWRKIVIYLDLPRDGVVAEQEKGNLNGTRDTSYNAVTNVWMIDGECVNQHFSKCGPKFTSISIWGLVEMPVLRLTPAWLNSELFFDSLHLTNSPGDSDTLQSLRNSSPNQELAD